MNHGQLVVDVYPWGTAPSHWQRFFFIPSVSEESLFSRIP